MTAPAPHLSFVASYLSERVGMKVEFVRVRPSQLERESGNAMGGRTSPLKNQGEISTRKVLGSRTVIKKALGRALARL